MPVAAERIPTGVPTILDSVQTSDDLDVYAHFRHELSLTHRPLQPIAAYPAEAQPISEESLRGWRGTAAYRAAEQAFVNYPGRSLCRPIDRMLLYHLVRSIRPAHVVEIGTYFAAGAEVLTRGLWENGQGVLHTVDPYGQIRGPALISRWDEQLRRHVRFYPWNSMAFFSHALEHKLQFDLSFIDGNHDFEFALFDLQMTARMIRPGGIVVMDDANQSGPFWAAKAFLDQNPGWKELGNCLGLAKAEDPFGPLPSLFEESKFLVLQAPREVVIGRVPYTTGEVGFGERQLDGYSFSLLPGQHGELVGRAFLRGFPVAEDPEQLQTRLRMEICGEEQRTLRFETSLRTRHAADAVLPRQTTEIVLLWRPAHGDEPLRLVHEPLAVRLINSSSIGR